MMTLDSNIPTKPSHNNQSSGSGKTGCLKPPEQGLKCPRCDSPNTKFCYYNNYSLSQPRHFCKTCRRYWTNGGALRNIPIGGSCRKHKKIKSNSGLSYDSKDTPSPSCETSNLKDLHGGSPSMEFQLGRHPFSRLSSSITSNVYNQFPSAIGTNNPACFHIDPSVNSSSLLAFDYHGSPNFKQEETWSLASSIESLSFINQDLHWRLQQQRLAEMLSEENHKKVSDATPQDQLQEPEPFLFENHEISEPEARVAGNTRKSGSVNGNITTEWFINTTNSINNGENITSNWSGIQAWGDLHQYGVLPQ